MRIPVLFQVASFLDDMTKEFPDVDMQVKVFDGDDADAFYTAQGRVMMSGGDSDAASDWYEGFGEKPTSPGDVAGVGD